MLTDMHPTNRFAHRLAAFSAIFGLILVLLYAMFRFEWLLIIGFYHLFPTVLVHIVTLLAVLGTAFIHKPPLGETFTTIVLMLLNIPLAYACFIVVIAFV